MSMPPALEGTSYINFLSSHDGIGLRPLEGLISDGDYKKLIQKLKLKKSLFTTRKQFNKNLIYEANITFFDALKENDKFDVDRFISAHALVLSIEGIPAIYVNSLFGSKNYFDGVRMTNSNRTINREKWNLNQIKEMITSESDQARIFYSLKKLIEIRKKQKAFHPNATSFTLQLGEKFFGIWRQSRDRKQSIFCITNFSKKSQTLQTLDLNLTIEEDWCDLISGENIQNDLIQVGPYDTLWISNLK
jgi:sucrose phosphorylase